MRPLLAYGVSTKVMTLPKGEDPDSLVSKQGKEAFLEASRKAVPILEFFLKRFYQDERDLSVKADAISELVETIKGAETVFLKEAIVEEASRIAGLEKMVLRGDQRLPLVSRSYAPKVPKNVTADRPTSKEEWILLRLAAQIDEARQRLTAEEGFVWFQDEGLVALAKSWLEKIKSLADGDRSISGFVDVWEDDNTRPQLARAFFDDGDGLSDEGHWEQIWGDCIKKLRQREIRASQRKSSRGE